ncbi:MAG: DUF1080 domain-containing protein [Verrucomicrobiota bacterium]
MPHPALRLIPAAPLLLAAALAGEPAAFTPRAPLPLFNGRDLAAFTVWLPASGTADPDRVFTVVERIDGAPAIRISGQHYGGLLTRDRFADYRFVLEFRWGAVTWAPRADRARDSGILFHCQGEPGNNRPDFLAPWMRSIEYQLIEGGSGDLILVGGHERGRPGLLFPTVRATVVPGTRRWSADGTEGEFGPGRNRTDAGYKDPAWRDVLGFRGRQDLERPVGEWNTVEVVCAGDRLEYHLNGTRVNAMRDASLREGRILIQSEGAELYVRRVELLPLAP